MKTLVFIIYLLALLNPATAQPILFDFENAQPGSSLPLSLSSSGLTAQFSATGQGYSIQRADTMGFTPAGFSGLCLYPNSINASDLMISFSARLVTVSVLYSPQELGCDTSARMRLSAFFDGVYVGTSNTNASQPGTWPSETLAITPTQPFNQIVVHYDQRPACADFGTIFLADNVQATLAPPPIILTDISRPPEAGIRFGFTNSPGASFTVFAATDISLPLANWASLGSPAEVSPGQFSFSDPPSVSAGRRFYIVRSP